MVFGRMETQSLIREVEKKEILWNHSGEHYYDKARKQKAWVEVCDVLFVDFKEMDDAQKKVVLRDVMGRWRTIRDNYVRKRKKLTMLHRSGSYGKRMKKYIFDEQLSFLKKVLERQPSICSSSNSSHQEQQNSQHFEFEDTKEGILDQSMSEQSLQEQSIPGQNMPEEILPDQSMTSTLAPQTPKKETESPSPIDDKVINFIERHKLSNIRAYDEDMSFFISLIPSVKKLSTMEKFDFRMQTMQILQNQLKQHPATEIKSDFQFAEFSTCDKMFLPEND